MSTTTKANIGANYLQNYLNKKVLENLRPNLLFAKIGKLPLPTDGFDSISWARPNKINVNVTNATLQEGVTPASQAFAYSIISAKPTQYGIYVTLSDRLLRAAPTNIISEATEEVGSTMALIIDQVVQTEVMAGTNVIYGGGKSNRTSVTATDKMTADLVRRSVTRMRARNARPADGKFFTCIVHTFQYGDLQENTPNNVWMEWSKYTTPDKLMAGEVGALYGARIVQTSNVQKFASSVDVYPALMLGKNAYGVMDFAKLSNHYNPPGSAGTADPIAQRATIGSKIDFAAKRLDEDSMDRIETAVGAY